VYNYFSKLAVDANGDLWALTSTGGAGLWHFDGTHWTTYYGAEQGGPLPESSARDLSADPRGGVWLAQENYVTYFNGQTATTHNIQDIGATERSEEHTSELQSR